MINRYFTHPWLQLKQLSCCMQVAPGSLTVLSIMGKVEDVNKVTGQLTLL